MSKFTLMEMYQITKEFSRNSVQHGKQSYKPDVSDKFFLIHEDTNKGTLVHINIFRAGQMLTTIRYGYASELFNEFSRVGLTFKKNEITDAIFTDIGWVSRADYNSVIHRLSSLPKLISTDVFLGQSVPTRSLIADTIYLLDDGQAVFHQVRKVEDRLFKLFYHVLLNQDGEFEIVSRAFDKTKEMKILTEYPNSKFSESLIGFINPDLKASKKTTTPYNL